MGDGLSSSSGSFTLNQGSNETFTFTVGEGTCISVAAGSVGIDYAGADNAILSASAASPGAGSRRVCSTEQWQPPGRREG